MKKGILFLVVGIVLVMFFVSFSSATDYYVDATNGLDSNNGLSEGSAWQTISKVNSMSFSPGDNIYFKRDEIWREQLNVRSSGSEGNPITFAAYGSGSYPIINGADILSTWTSETVGSFTAYYASTSYEANLRTQVFENNDRLYNVSTKNDLLPGTWWWDSGNSRIYIRTSGDDNPSGYTIEASHRTGIRVDNKDYINIANFTLTKGIRGINLYAPNSDVSNINIQSCISSWNYFAGIRGTGRRDFYSVKNVTIDNCTVKYNGGTGIYATSNSSTWTISNNIVHNNAILDLETEHSWTAGIRAISAGSKNFIYEDNVVFSNGKLNGIPVISGYRGYGIWFDSLYVFTAGSGSIMRRNRVYDNYQHGIRVEATSNAEVYYNIVYENGQVGISISREVHNNTIYNNVVFNNKGTGIRVNGNHPLQPDDVTNNIVKNNIAVGNILEFDARNGGDNDGIVGYNNVYEYNCFGFESDNFLMWGNVIYKDSYYEWETAYCGSDGCSHSVESDPLLTNAPAGIFTLQANSPAINAGIDVGLTQDFDGNPIVGLPDIGAFEYQGMQSSCSQADTNLDNMISMTELMSYIADWKTGSVTMVNLMTAIGEWKNGC